MARKGRGLARTVFGGETTGEVLTVAAVADLQLLCRLPGLLAVLPKGWPVKQVYIVLLQLSTEQKFRCYLVSTNT